jgi:hypothetical protein
VQGLTISGFSFAHDLVGKPLHTFPDHALAWIEADGRKLIGLFR